MHRKVCWEEMFPDELRAAIARRPVCYFAYGLCEPHGPQSALGLDGHKAYGVVLAAARAHGGVVAPPTWWHISEVPLGDAFWEGVLGPGWREIGATFRTALPPQLFYHQLLYHLRAAELAGCRVALLVTGHAGGLEVDMRMVVAAYCARRPLRAAAVVDAELIRYRDYRGDHAGPCETSQLWALRPDLVDLGRLEGKRSREGLFASSPTAAQASRREGERIVRSQVRSLKRLSDRLLAEARSQPPAAWFPPEENEAIWEQVLAQQAQWVVTHPLTGFAEHARAQAQRYPPASW